MEEENLLEKTAMAKMPMTGGEICSRPIRENTYDDNISLLKRYEINIRFLSVGCIIHVGCVQVPFETIEKAMHSLQNYIESPVETKKYWEEKMNNKY